MSDQYYEIIHYTREDYHNEWYNSSVKNIIPEYVKEKQNKVPKSDMVIRPNDSNNNCCYGYNSYSSPFDREPTWT
jgi:hypothetical protein